MGKIGVSYKLMVQLIGSPNLGDKFWRGPGNYVYDD